MSAGSRILVTGATGFLGRRVCECLRGTRPVRATARRIGVDGPWQEAVTADLADDVPASLVAGVDAVIHLAATAHRHHLRLDDDAAFAPLNVEGTRRLCAAASAAGVRRVVLASSVSVFADGDAAVPEDAAPAPSSAYGRSKLAAEEIVRAGCAEPVVLRFPLLYGPGMPGNLARMVQAIEARRFPPVPRVDNRRSMLHVDDAAAALVLAATIPGAAGRVYTVTDGRAYATHQVAAWVRAALGRGPARGAPPAAMFRWMAGAGDAFAAITGRRAPFDGAAYRKLLGSAEYASAAIVRELGFAPRHDLERAMPAIVAALRAPRDTA